MLTTFRIFFCGVKTINGEISWYVSPFRNFRFFFCSGNLEIMRVGCLNQFVGQIFLFPVYIFDLRYLKVYNSCYILLILALIFTDIFIYRI